MNEELKLSINARLGAPLRQIELEEIHYKEAYDDARETLFLLEHLGNAMASDQLREIWVKKYTIANCKEYLGRIRGKFGGVVGKPFEERIMDNESLIAESIDEKHALTNLIY